MSQSILEDAGSMVAMAMAALAIIHLVDLVPN